MKLWKGATLAILLCCASLCIFVTKPAVMPAAMPPTPAKQNSLAESPMSPPLLSTSSSPSTTSQPSQSASFSSPPRSTGMGGRRRRVRSADNVGALLSECKLACFCLWWQQCNCWWGGTWKALTAGQGFSLSSLFMRLGPFLSYTLTQSQLAPHKSKQRHRPEWLRELRGATTLKCANILRGMFETTQSQGQFLGSNNGWVSASLHNVNSCTFR